MKIFIIILILGLVILLGIGVFVFLRQGQKTDNQNLGVPKNETALCPGKYNASFY